MSPEQTTNNHERISITNDVYGLKTILYHLLTEQPPYTIPKTIQTTHNMIRHIRNKNPQPIDKIAPKTPTKLHAIVQKTIQRAPKKRYPKITTLTKNMITFIKNQIINTNQHQP